MPRPVVPLLATNNSSVKNFAVPERLVFERSGARAGYSRLLKILVAIARRNHLFPFRTEKLSSAALMVLPKWWESRSSPVSFRKAPLRRAAGLFRFKDTLIKTASLSASRSHVKDVMIASFRSQKTLRIRCVTDVTCPSGGCEKHAGCVIPHGVGPATLLRHSLPACPSQASELCGLNRSILKDVCWGL